MERAMAWLGLSRASVDDAADGGIPRWQGVAARKKHTSGAICLLVAIATFVLMRWLMPADDGLSGAARDCCTSRRQRTRDARRDVTG